MDSVGKRNWKAQQWSQSSRSSMDENARVLLSGVKVIGKVDTSSSGKKKLRPEVQMVAQKKCGNTIDNDI